MLEKLFGNESGNTNAKPRNWKRRLAVWCLIFLALYVGIMFLLSFFENAILFHPTHRNSEVLAAGSGFEKWVVEGRYTGWKRLIDSESRTWLFIHGNAGQAMHRLYAEACFDRADNIFILEYPGYGEREGSPSMESFNQAAADAYGFLKKEFPENRICILGESIGSGPACYLAAKNDSPEKIVLVTPFARLAELGKEKFPFLPVASLIKNNWDNIENLKSFDGDIEVYGAKHDRIIPVNHARKLAGTKDEAKLHLLECGHNEWSHFVKFQ